MVMRKAFSSWMEICKGRIFLVNYNKVRKSARGSHKVNIIKTSKWISLERNDAKSQDNFHISSQHESEMIFMVPSCVHTPNATIGQWCNNYFYYYCTKIQEKYISGRIFEICFHFCLFYWMQAWHSCGGCGFMEIEYLCTLNSFSR